MVAVVQFEKNTVTFSPGPSSLPPVKFNFLLKGLKTMSPVEGTLTLRETYPVPLAAISPRFSMVTFARIPSSAIIVSPGWGKLTIGRRSTSPSRVISPSSPWAINVKGPKISRAMTVSIPVIFRISSHLNANRLTFPSLEKGRGLRSLFQRRASAARLWSAVRPQARGPERTPSWNGSSFPRRIGWGSTDPCTRAWPHRFPPG